jgi:hypothetical protein
MCRALLLVLLVAGCARVESQYLVQGQQTEFPLDEVPGFIRQSDDPVREVLEYASSMRHDSNGKMKIFRRRTARDIYESGFTTGCTDAALIAIAMWRALGIPAVYVETIKTSWLENPQRMREGHIFAEIYVDGKWIITDPQRGKIVDDYAGYTVIARGLDSWDIGVFNDDDSRKMFDDAARKYPR